MNHDTDSNSPWYEEGLRFECTRCGRCCRGPGNVWINDEEIEALAKLIGRSVDEFRKSHTRRGGRRGVVLRQKRNQDCIFWDDGAGCTVYTARPKQCSTYPFWKAVLHSEYNWQSERRSCPGVGEGPLHNLEEIESKVSDDGIPAHRTRTRER
jgi:Fe-S-cluster containining protein